MDTWKYIFENNYPKEADAGDGNMPLLNAFPSDIKESNRHVRKRFIRIAVSMIDILKLQLNSSS